MQLVVRPSRWGMPFATLLVLSLLPAASARAAGPKHASALADKDKDESGHGHGAGKSRGEGHGRGQGHGHDHDSGDGECCQRVRELEAEVARLRDRLRHCDGDYRPGDHGRDCVRSHGYWKNHEPWPEDGTLCGRSWRSLLSQESEGDAWVILARQWIAARLNQESGASVPPEVARALAAGERLLNACSIAPADRQRALEVKDVLDAYVNGRMGVAKCQ